ncbi:hypothetical protein HPB49_017612 [Dermacentor silvarum]|uniref:Uncharacterized protein n=1 Tax=Dermacentor silvarum TaxID=543639 RepID=A0ACB8E1R1_DERSI|nr:hypothetical protein HPB49_017612 [Dermacentor silvarum]
MESDSDYTLVQSRHLKRKLRRTSAGSDSTHKSRCDDRVFSVGYTPTTAGTNLNSLNRQSLTKFFDRIASGHVREIRINARKNILTVDVSSQAVLEALKSIEVVGNIPVRSFLAYGNDTCTGVVSDVDIDIKDEDLRSLLSSTTKDKTAVPIQAVEDLKVGAAEGQGNQSTSTEGVKPIEDEEGMDVVQPSMSSAAGKRTHDKACVEEPQGPPTSIDESLPKSTGQRRASFRPKPNVPPDKRPATTTST